MEQIFIVVVGIIIVLLFIQMIFDPYITPSMTQVHQHKLVCPSWITYRVSPCPVGQICQTSQSILKATFYTDCEFSGSYSERGVGLYNMDEELIDSAQACAGD